MQYKSHLLFPFILFLLVLSACQDQSALKLGYVESNRLLSEYNETQKAAKKLEKNTELLRKRFDTLRTELEQMQEEFTQNLAAYSPEKRREKETQVNRKKAEVDKYYRIMSEKIREEDEKATQAVLKKINKVVKRYGKENNYTFIFGATTNGNLVYAADAKNLTDEIIEELNR